MKNDIDSVIKDALNNVNSIEDVYDTDSVKIIEEKVNEQNSKINKEKKEKILSALKKINPDINIDKNISLEELEEIYNKLFRS